jgi:RNA polymerase sigma-70 factor, ECF subfamily
MDERARFELMYRAHGSAVRSFVHRRVASGDADDLVADVFVAAWRRFGQSPADELPWLFGIARGVVANHRRGNQRRSALRERLQQTAVASVVSGPDIGSIDPRRLARAFAGLSERDRELLRLVAWDGLDRAQAAQVLQIPERLFSVRLHRARRRLSRALDEQPTEDRVEGFPQVEAKR